jgi:hypothetical protein
MKAFERFHIINGCIVPSEVIKMKSGRKSCCGFVEV